MTLAEENSFFENRKFVLQWDKDLLALKENQQYETINYMLEYVRESQIRSTTEAEIAEFYHRNRHLYRRPDFFKLQTIVLNDRIVAYRVYNEAKRDGTDFTSLVLTHSNDPLAHYSNGIGPFLDKTALEKSYDTLVNSATNDIIPPIEVDTEVWHVHKVIDRVQGAVRPIDEVVSQVVTKLMYEKMQDYFRELVYNYGILIIIHDDRIVQS